MEELLLLGYAGLGAFIRSIYAVYKAYSNYEKFELNWRRLAVEFIASVSFGVFGAVILNEMGFWKVGTNIVAILSGLLGANLIDLIAKRFGMGKELKVNVVEKVECPELNANQQRALSYLKKGKKLTTKIYQAINQVGRRKAQCEIWAMVQLGYLVRVGKEKKTYYKLTEDR